MENVVNPYKSRCVHTIREVLLPPLRTARSRAETLFGGGLFADGETPDYRGGPQEIVSSNLPWERLFGKTVLISGANGFVPSYMLDVLLYLNETASADIHAIALVRNKEKAMRRLGHLAGRPDLNMVVQDVRDPYGGPDGIDFVIHAASQASPKYYSIDPVGTFAANIMGTWRMLKAARDSRSQGFLFFSSGEVYGQFEGFVPSL